MYITILVKQVYWYISQVSGERLQDHWSSGCLNSPGAGVFVTTVVAGTIAIIQPFDAKQRPFLRDVFV